MFNSPLNNKAENIKVVELSLIPTGRYNPQFARPYTLDLNPGLLNQITNTVDESLNMGSAVTPMAVACMGANIVTPIADHQGLVDIVNGWDTQRLRFRLVVDVQLSVGGTNRYYYTGYTDHMGVTNMGAHYDNQMVFYISSIIKSRVINQHTPFGMISNLNVSRTNHLLCDNNWQGALNTQQTYLMRPEDIYNNMATKHVQEHAKQFLDTRNVIQRTVLENNVTNGLPNNYVSNILDGFVKASITSSLNTAESSIFTDARNHVSGAKDPNPLITAISNVRGYHTMSNTFTLEELKRVDPFCPEPNLYSLTQQDLGVIGNANDQLEWVGSDGCTVAAVGLSQSIPAIMTGVGLQSISFVSTNDTLGCIVDTRIGNFSCLDQTDAQRRALTFKTRLESEVIPAMTFNGALRYYVAADVDLFGECHITIGLNGEEIRAYTMPLFAGNAVAPVISKSPDHTTRIINDFGLILDRVQEVATSRVAQSPTLMTPNLV